MPANKKPLQAPNPAKNAAHVLDNAKAKALKLIESARRANSFTLDMDMKEFPMDVRLSVQNWLNKAGWSADARADSTGVVRVEYSYPRDVVDAMSSAPAPRPNAKKTSAGKAAAPKRKRGATTQRG